MGINGMVRCGSCNHITRKALIVDEMCPQCREIIRLAPYEKVVDRILLVIRSMKGSTKGRVKAKYTEIFDIIREELA